MTKRRVLLVALTLGLAWLATVPFRLVDTSPNDAMYWHPALIPLDLWVRGARTWADVERMRGER